VTHITIRYGDEERRATLPDGIAITHVEPVAPASTPDPLAVVANALDAPIDAPRLEELAAKAKRVAIVIPDGTRRASAHVYLLPVLARLARVGRGPAQIKLVMARGIHAATHRNVVEEMLGRELMHVMRPLQSAPSSPEMNRLIGTDPEIGEIRVHRDVADADLVILTGPVTTHHLAGFGGGPKALVPGVADRATVLAAHRLTLASLVRPDGSIRSVSGSFEGNAFYEALLRVARAFGKTWLLNVVLDPEGDIVAAAAGEVGAAHRAAADAWMKTHEMPTPQPHDMVIVGVGGARSGDLIQCHKGLLRALAWAKPGAPIVWAAAAPNGPGHGELLPWFTAGKLPVHLLALRKQFHPYGLTAYSIRRIAKDHPVYVTSEMSKDLLRPMGLLRCRDLDGAIRLALDENEVSTCAVLPG
jgi:nickel-dependent lactate racemase